MKLSLVLFALCVLAGSVVAQEETDWKIMPGVVLVKYFPGADIRGQGEILPLIYPGDFTPYEYSYKYAATGIHFNVRSLHKDIKPFAVTFGGGVNWFYRPDRSHVVDALMHTGVAASMGRRDFTTFPLSAGVQIIYPYDSPERLMVHGGVEGNLQLVAGDIDISQQAKGGYSLLAGFAVKVFEFGVRYTSFSDLRNLGAHIGFRLNSFGI